MAEKRRRFDREFREGAVGRSEPTSEVAVGERVGESVAEHALKDECPSRP